MINPVHAKLNDKAIQLISENGAPVTLWREVTTGPAYDPSITVETLDNVIAVRTNYNQNEIGDGSRIKSTDIKFLIDSVQNPLEYQKIISGTDEMQIIDAVIIKPGELTMLYKVQARL